MAAQARVLAAELSERPGDPSFISARLSLSADLSREVTAAEAADVLAQGVVCAAAILGRITDSGPVGWLRESASEWERWIYSHAVGTPYTVLSTQYPSDLRHCYDQFLHAYDRTSRKRHGVFFTPQPIADYIVGRIDQTLIEDFGIPDGLASQSAIRNPQSAIIVDPACGTGVFLLAVIDHLHRRLAGDWNEFVSDLLPRLTGIELLPVPAFLAKLNIALKLAATGYDFRLQGKTDIRIGDALTPDLQSAIRNPQSTIPILLGNPPFSSLSTNTNPWIAELVRGSDEVRGYVQAGDERLGERKTWLHDDYVKFIRLAQWQVEQAGQGIVGFVTSRGYLDNATFRLMRRELMRVFPHIQLVDLHGSRKGGGAAPDASRDENVFGLDQGASIGIFMKTRRVSEGAGRVDYHELRGSRDAKLAALARGGREQASGGHEQASGGREPPEAKDVHALTPQSPHWLFVPAAAVSHPEYAASWSLTDAMPMNTTAPVTARDHFVVAFTREDLHARIGEFRDLSIPDETIRAKYFTRTRSSRYPLGDTRGWKLAEARRTVAGDNDWQAQITRCLYRPFDWRYVFWHPAMIDWPRREVTQHLIEDPGGRGQETVAQIRNPQSATRNLCLIARRQQLPGRPCTFFWIADGLALDGVIRSDNRGSESLFPLMWSDRPDRTDAACRPSIQANFNARFVEQARALAGNELPAEKLLAYVYALFHSPTYRERYAAELRMDFPRVLLPASGVLFLELASIGRRLIDAHLLRDLKGSGDNYGHDHPGWKTLTAIDSRPIPDDLRVGGYYAIRKWLQPKHRSSGDSEYQRIAGAVAQTHRLMVEIDAAIERHGSFPAAFAM